MLAVLENKAIIGLSTNISIVKQVCIYKVTGFSPVKDW